MSTSQHHLHLHLLLPDKTVAAKLHISADCALDEHLFDATLTPAQRACLIEQPCRLSWRSLGGESGQWWLQCQSQRWHCAINDAPLAHGQSRPLHAGDRIELGLLVLAVAGAAMPAAVDACTALLDRSALDELQARSAQWQLHDDNLFGMIPAAFDGDDEPGPGKYGDQGILAGTHPDASADAARVNPVPDSFLLQDDDLAVHRNFGCVAQELGAAYLRALREPEAQHFPIAEATTAALSETRLPTPTELAAQLPPDLSIEELISGPLDIDQLLAHFGTQQWQPPDTTLDEDVLILFAPPGAVIAARSKLPALTQREHHAFSPDSAYRAASRVSQEDAPAPVTQFDQSGPAHS